MLNINSVLTDAAAAMVDDSFLKCFTSAAPDPWNWNFYLAPLWYAWSRGLQHAAPQLLSLYPTRQQPCYVSSLSLHGLPVLHAWCICACHYQLANSVHQVAILVTYVVRTVLRQPAATGHGLALP
eukprot:GHRR01037180.1.p1 GENE.GHRR01037180.1~~GHRR01037180.1.p1  ORF type:complete len:125 (-),score=35.89 GHRR01037180.1:14-388(-)